MQISDEKKRLDALKSRIDLADVRSPVLSRPFQNNPAIDQVCLDSNIFCLYYYVELGEGKKNSRID